MLGSVNSAWAAVKGIAQRLVHEHQNRCFYAWILCVGAMPGDYVFTSYLLGLSRKIYVWVFWVFLSWKHAMLMPCARNHAQEPCAGQVLTVIAMAKPCRSVEFIVGYLQLASDLAMRSVKSNVGYLHAASIRLGNDGPVVQVVLLNEEGHQVHVLEDEI